MVRELIAILRGVEPHEAVAIAEELILSGITKIEVPLNSPKAYESIENIANRFSGEAIIGAGTVLGKNEVASVCNAGGKMIVVADMNVANSQVAIGAHNEFGGLVTDVTIS